MTMLLSVICCSLSCLLFLIQPSEGATDWEADRTIDSTEPRTYNEVLQQPAMADNPDTDMDPMLLNALRKFLVQYTAGRYGQVGKESVRGLRSLLHGKHLQPRKTKRQGDGVWIWMPAQGYVSVPRHNGEDMQGGTKVGKVMRYGR